MEQCGDAELDTSTGQSNDGVMRHFECFSRCETRTAGIFGHIESCQSSDLSVVNLLDQSFQEIRTVWLDGQPDVQMSLETQGCPPKVKVYMIKSELPLSCSLYYQ